MNLKEFISVVTFAAHASDPKRTRYYLRGVYFEARGTDLFVVGTDGQRMAVARIGNGVVPNGGLSVLISHVDVKVMAVMMGKLTAPADARLLPPDDVYKYGALQLGGQVFVGAEGGQHYPDWRRVRAPETLPKPTQCRDINVNSRYLVEAAKALAKLSPLKEPAVRVRPGVTETDSIRVTLAHADKVFVEADVTIMPVRR